MEARSAKDGMELEAGSGILSSSAEIDKSHPTDAPTRRRRVENPGGGLGTGQGSAEESPAGQSLLHTAILMIPPLPFMTGPDRHQESQRGPGGLCCRFLESFLSQIFANSWTKGPAWNGEGLPPVT